MDKGIVPYAGTPIRGQSAGNQMRKQSRLLNDLTHNNFHRKLKIKSELRRKTKTALRARERTRQVQTRIIMNLSKNLKLALIGMLLGDANLQSFFDTARLRILHSTKQFDYLSHKYALFQPIIRTQIGFLIVCRYGHAFSELIRPYMLECMMYKIPSCSPENK